MSSPLYLNLGAGSVTLPGFVSVDREPGADYQLDLTQPLPWANRTVSGIYSEHFIEHITQAQGIGLLHECHRVMMPGGILRIATPDLDDLVQYYMEDYVHPDWPKYGYGWIDNRCERLNLAMREWGHQWVYNEAELTRLACMVGFEVRGRYPRNVSDDPHFQNLETRESSALVMEFVKPERGVGADDWPLVSIVIPSFKPQFFAEALDSALQQTYPNIEVLVSDDCRTDAIADIVNSRAKDDPRVRYVHNATLQNNGWDNAIQCVTLARGEFVKFLCDDDMLEPHCVDRMVHCFRTEPDLTLVTSRRQRIDPDGRPLPDIIPTRPLVDSDSVVEGRSLIEAFLATGTNFIGEPSTVMFRKSEVAGMKPDFMCVDGKQMLGVNDVAIYLNLAIRGNAVYLSEPLSRFRIHPEQNQVVFHEELVPLTTQSLNWMREAWMRRFPAADLVRPVLRCRPLGDPAQSWRHRIVQMELSAPALAAKERPPRVSVILPTCDHAPFVSAAIDSVLRQTFQDFELIVVDNGSGAGASAVIAGYADPRIRHLAASRPRSPGAMLNEGIRVAAGDYIAVLDAVDWCKPDRLARQVAWLDDHPGTGAVFSHAERVDAAGKAAAGTLPADDGMFRAVNRSRLEWLRQFFFTGNALCHSSAMVRRAVSNAVGLYNERLGQACDFEFWIRLCLTQDIHVIQDPLVCCRLLPNRAGGGDNDPDVLASFCWEWRKALDRFLGISPADLTAAFPEIQGYVEQLDANAVPYALARLGLDNRQAAGPVTCQFGLDILFTLLDPALGFDIRTVHGYQPTDLIHAVGDAQADALGRLKPAMYYAGRLQQDLEALDVRIAALERERQALQPPQGVTG